MTENNNIENLFKDAFSNYEVPVDASLWQGIEQVVGQPPVTATVVANTVVKSFSVFKLFVAAAAVSVLGVTSYVVFDKKEVKPSPKVETNTNLYNNAGSVSETVTQPTPEKIVVKETKPVSATKKQSSPEIFPSAETPNSITNNVGEKTKGSPSPSYTSEHDHTSPKPSETTFAKTDAGKSSLDVTKEKEEPKAEQHEPSDQKQPVLAKESPVSKEKVYPFPGQDTQSFSPNGDGKNDVYSVDDSQMASISVKILSSSGKKIYLRDQLGVNWNGTLENGDEAPQGLYIVFINGTGFDGKKYSRITRLMLVRN